MKKILFFAATAIIACILTGYGNAVCRADERMPEEKQQTEKPKPICRVCGMYIERFKRTAAYAEYKNGSLESYCGVACAIRAINEHGGLDEVRVARVTSWTDEKPVELKQAVYVIGSKLIPDMLPNIIAFESKEAAEGFIRDNGGKIESLDVLLVSTSYRGLTAPFRIPAAAVPSQGVFNAGASVGTKVMQGVKRKTRKVLDSDVFATKTMAPEKMVMYTAALGMGYGLTDDFFCNVNIPYVAKRMDTEYKTGAVTNINQNGLGDVALTAKWRFWHDLYYDKHLALLATLSTPTGRFSNSLISSPNVQAGTGAFSFAPGLGYSQHVGKFWFHGAGTYKMNMENAHDYKYGNAMNYGLAAHFLPNTSDLIGLEFDVERCYKNEYAGSKVVNTGRTTASCNLVYQRKIMLCWGGNVNVNGLLGSPVFEKVEDTQLGEKFHAAVGIQWQRKF